MTLLITAIISKTTSSSITMIIVYVVTKATLTPFTIPTTPTVKKTTNRPTEVTTRPMTIIPTITTMLPLIWRKKNKWTQPSVFSTMSTSSGFVEPTRNKFL